MRQVCLKAAKADIGCAQGLRLPVYLLAAFLQLLAFHCQAGSYVLIKSGNGEIYTRFEKSLNVTLTNINQQNSLTTLDIDAFNSPHNISVLTSFDAIISAGIEASIAVSNAHSTSPTIMAMLPKESYADINNPGKIICNIKNCHILLIDQPVQRQLQLLKLALPSANQISIISSHESSRLLTSITQNASKFGMTINNITVSDEDDVLSALNQNLTNSDVLMAIPDAIVYNRNTARAILLSAFHRRIPLFAYSRSFVRAGAILGIYSTPEDIARQVAELLSGNPKNTVTPLEIYPKYYTIDINQRAADALGITIPDAALLAKRLQANEKE